MVGTEWHEAQTKIDLINDKIVCGCLKFRDPLETIWGMSPLESSFINDKKHYTYKAKSYDYVIFPSWLYHETQPNGKDERIAISINFSGFPLDPSEGDYGSS